MATSTNLKVAQTGDDRNTCKKLGYFPKKGGAEMAVGVRQAPRGRLGAPPVQ